MIVLTTSLETNDPRRLSNNLYQNLATININQLMRRHIIEWEKIYESGITVEGNKEVADHVSSSLYYILSSIRKDWDYSLSPGSLSTNTYNAHVFWDTETCKINLT
jgi:protein-glucosylgalactosylhydroxylysine glucosidase